FDGVVEVAVHGRVRVLVDGHDDVAVGVDVVQGEVAEEVEVVVGRDPLRNADVPGEAFAFDQELFEWDADGAEDGLDAIATAGESGKLKGPGVHLPTEGGV